jgi:asparagine synthase (glutamine-hydrolysing)
MCGIFGIVGKNAIVAPDLLERATNSLAHRGPDDSGTILLRKSTPVPVEIGLGNRRLAILDLSPLAHQPMYDAKTGNWIVYNGEIYNFREVRKELEQADTRFISHSDTEVVLKAYATWGEQCLTKFRGMFAFAIWDARRHCLFLARDPMGIKPLYYFQSNTHFLFASEVRTLLGTGLVPRLIDPSGLVNFLTFGSAYDPLTLIKGIHALPPGHTLVWENGDVSLSQYWDLIDDEVESQEVGKTSKQGSGACDFASGEEEQSALTRLQPILEDVVRLQLVSDVPVGIFLSGGIDSSALVSILSRSGVTPATFSIVFREAEFSEALYSRAVARKFRTDHHEINVSEDDLFATIPDALKAMDLPTMDGVNTYFVSREARRAGVKVALSGLGGDEIFGGYSSFRTVPRLERFAQLWSHLPSAARMSLSSIFSVLVPQNDQNRKLISLGRDNGGLLHPYFLTRMLFTPSQRDLLFSSVKGAIIKASADSQRLALQRALALDPVNRVSYLESRCYMLNTLLRDADFMSMSQGLEVRVPLIDHQLAKAVLALPGKWKLNRTPKKLLVESLAGSLPDEIVHRHKRGFTMPFDRWMRQELRSEIESVLTAKRVDNGPLGGTLVGGRVHDIWQQFIEGTISWSRPWALYVLQRWCDQHLS